MLLFAYGTLQNPVKMAELIERSPAPPRPATLAGYRSVPTRLGYPALFPAPGQRTAGLLWTGLTPEEVRRLDEYEECFLTVPAYLRRELPVTSHRGLVWAWTYVGNPEFFRDLLVDGSIP